MNKPSHDEAKLILKWLLITDRGLFEKLTKLFRAKQQVKLEREIEKVMIWIKTTCNRSGIW